MTKLVIDLFDAWSTMFTREFFSNQTSTIYQSKSLSVFFSCTIFIFVNISPLSLYIEANDTAFRLYLCIYFSLVNFLLKKFSFIVANLSSVLCLNNNSNKKLRMSGEKKFSKIFGFSVLIAMYPSIFTFCHSAG